MEFYKMLEKILIELWNELYRFLCGIWGDEVNEDWIVPIPGEED